MNLRAIAKRWLVEATQAVATLTIAFTAVLTLATGSNLVQSTEFGTTALASGLAILTYIELRLLSKYEWAQPWWFSGSWLDKGRVLAIVAAFLLPLAISSLVNESIAAAFNPSGYWKSELKEAAKSDCSTTYEDMLADLLEGFHVAQNKYGMGIATSSEVEDAARLLQIVSDSYQACQSTARTRMARASHRLAELARE